ncbi:MAG: DUF2442 domain-containing protein [Verrucomicrobia bacterium]|nr:DUF2442 domain-containing protein [Verrucomicrobiota bacterium]
MIIQEVKPLEAGILQVITEDGRSGTVDVSQYLDSPAFAPLRSWDTFVQIKNGKYYVEWTCGADLSADTLEAKMQWSV